MSKNNFKKTKYIVVKNVITSELADFFYKYFLLKRRVTDTLSSMNHTHHLSYQSGTYNDKQIPNTYSIYSDLVMETLLVKLLPVMEKQTKLKLVPNYSYSRIYKHGDILNRHKDRFSCEISTTLNLGGDSWPIFLEPEKNVGIPGENGITAFSNNPGIKIDLEPGDMLIYSGCIFEHWREAFEGENCGQVFLHYNNIETQGESNKFDKRPFLGLPSKFKK